MPDQIDRWIEDYRRGRLSRRDLLAALIPLAAAAPVSASAAMPAKTLNHVSLAVSDVDRSRQFYQDLFQAPVISKQSNGINLGLGTSSFLGLYKIGDRAGSIDHFCIGLDSKVPDAAAVLESHGVKPRIRDRDGVKELYFRDPDNIQVQLQEAAYRG